MIFKFLIGYNVTKNLKFRTQNQDTQVRTTRFVLPILEFEHLFCFKILNGIFWAKLRENRERGIFGVWKI